MSFLTAHFLSTDVHARPRKEMTLASCRCVQINASDVVLGDFRYHYSGQLDAFTLYEVTKIDREHGICYLTTIDEDSPEVAYYSDGRGYGDGEHSLTDGYGKWYHPDPEDRKRVESKGFTSQYVPLVPHLCRPIQPRKLHVKLYHRPVQTRIRDWVKKVLAGTSGWWSTLRLSAR